MYLKNDVKNWADWFNDICILRVMDIHWSYNNLLFWAGIVWPIFQPTRFSDVSKFKNLKAILRIKLIFCFYWSCKKYRTILGSTGKYSWPISLQDFFTFDLCDLLILIPAVHCYIVIVNIWLFCLKDTSIWICRAFTV